jgi:hypothetical protein
MPSPTFQMRLDPEDRRRWQAARAYAEQPLAEFIRECVEEKLSRPSVPAKPLRADPWVRLMTATATLGNAWAEFKLALNAYQAKIERP